MDSDNRKYVQIKKATLIIAVLILGAGLFGWWLGHSDDSKDTRSSNTMQSGNDAKPASNNNTTSQEVKSLVTYTLPDGWKDAACPSASGTVSVVPFGAGDVDCNANPSSPIKISVDSANNTDCNQLQNVQNVSKHICISEYINGHKSLKAETVYNKDSAYKKVTAINAYYIDTGKGVVKVEYIHNPNENEYQTGFEQLAKSVQVKS